MVCCSFVPMLVGGISVLFWMIESDVILALVEAVGRITDVKFEIISVGNVSFSDGSVSGVSVSGEIIFVVVSVIGEKEIFVEI
jgi:hypothetical protein